MYNSLISFYSSLLIFHQENISQGASEIKMEMYTYITPKPSYTFSSSWAKK